MANKKRKFKKDLFSEYILYGIFVGLAVFFVIKTFFGTLDKMDEFEYIVLSVNVLGGVLIVGFGAFLLSNRSIKNELTNVMHELVVFLQNKSLLAMEYKIEKQKSIKSTKNKIFTLISSVADKVTNLTKKNSELESTIGSLTDIKGGVTSISQVKGEIRTVTVLFTDVRNFTNLCENLQVEDIIKFLNSYLNNVTQVVHKYGGVVNKFIGDAVMAIFEPSKYEDDKFSGPELKAISAALEIHQSFDKAIQESGVRVLRPIQVGIGIGINTGSAVLGTIGSKARMEFTVIGDTVNIASRLSMMAGIGVTLIGADTYEKLKTKIDVIETEPIEIKGKIGLHKVYIVKGFNLIDR